MAAVPQIPGLVLGGSRSPDPAAWGLPPPRAPALCLSGLRPPDAPRRIRNSFTDLEVQQWMRGRAAHERAKCSPQDTTACRSKHVESTQAQLVPPACRQGTRSV